MYEEELSVKSSARSLLTPLTLLQRKLHPHLAFSLLPLLCSRMWVSLVAWGGVKRPGCRAIIANSPLMRLCPFSHSHLSSFRGHSEGGTLLSAMVRPVPTDPTLPLQIVTGGRFSDGETRDKRVTGSPGCEQGPGYLILTFLTGLLSALQRTARAWNVLALENDPSLLSAASGAHLPREGLWAPASHLLSGGERRI